VSLSIYDASGRQVRRLEPPTIVSAGRYTRVWDGRTEVGAEAAPGMYLARLVVDGVRFERNIPLVR
jgi:flagellar hook assembly protein FlgD